MWLFLVHSEHVKCKGAVSEEIGNFTTNSTSGTSGNRLSMQRQSEAEWEKWARGLSRAPASCFQTLGSHYGAQFEVDESYVS